MKSRSSVMVSSLLAIAAAGVFLEGGVAAQYGERTIASRTPPAWENDQFRVRRITAPARRSSRRRDRTRCSCS